MVRWLLLRPGVDSGLSAPGIIVVSPIGKSPAAIWYISGYIIKI